MKKQLTVFILTMILATLAFGQQAVGRSGLSYVLGINDYSGGTEDDFGWIPIHQIQFTHRLHRFFGMELSSGLGVAEVDDNPEDFRTYYFPYHINLKIMPLIGYRINPYGIIGYGTHITDIRDQTSGEPPIHLLGFGKGHREFGSQIDKQFTFGGGLEYFISDRFGLDASMRYGIYQYESFDHSGYGDSNENNTEIRLGLTYYFGNPIDSDGDGVPDKDDLAPKDPEDKDCFEDSDGAPDLDNDQDGIPDELDVCPNEPEDFDDFEDKDGCPEYDNDGDRIPDNADAAPNDPEDYDGFEDEDGAPDLDNDGDGINDLEDQCPNAAETMNGYEDEDGCPDSYLMEASTGTDDSGMLLNIYFDTNKSVPTDDSQDNLELLLDQLRSEGIYNILIKGYADKSGSDEYNIKLSLKRAEWVKDYLVKNGFRKETIATMGFGKSIEFPDMAKNRTVKIIMISR
ncbi:MAG: OmpA family protein [Candidatus Marinimicrobia bacterium]|nr:OmpA family protein [Candidatus Neomarinimicrobiota bacterium]